jgi:hypothetical protein
MINSEKEDSKRFLSEINNDLISLIVIFENL